MDIGGEVVELAIELIGAAFGTGADKPDPLLLVHVPDAAQLTPEEHALAEAIQARRGVSAAIARDLVVWLRDQRGMSTL